MLVCSTAPLFKVAAATLPLRSLTSWMASSGTHRLGTCSVTTSAAVTSLSSVTCCDSLRTVVIGPT